MWSPVFKVTVLSHPHSRKAARKGEVIKKVKPGMGGVSSIKLLRTLTPQWQARERTLKHVVAERPMEPTPPTNLLFYSTLS